jgi:hypothetical protein
VFEPTEFEPVTTTRMVKPTSAAVRTYLSAVAPAISAQLAPAASQRRH